MSAGLPWTWGDPGRTSTPATPRGYEGTHLVRAVRVAAPPEVIYQAAPDPDVPGGCVLRCDLFLAPATGLGARRATLLAWGDLVMMRKQLLTLRELSERTR